MPCQSAAISASNCGVPVAGKAADWGRVPGSVVVVVVVVGGVDVVVVVLRRAVAVALAGGAVRTGEVVGDGRTT